MRAEAFSYPSKTHLQEVVASNPGFVRGARYELLHPDPRSDVGPRWLAEFNTFYTNIHVPEVMAHRGYRRGTRFERHCEFRHPQPGRRPLSSGPPTWEKHDTLWRLVYRRIEL